ncbi:MAG: hypothetical protein KTR24_10340 [Saprospiraceae bacterium]|nr:hypothetical protein [Saprospiraceae bacterium]
MKIKGLYFVLLILMSVQSGLLAQRTRDAKSNEFTSNLWYGGSAGLGFQSFNSESTFLIALYPMVGYKFTEQLSVGPRIGVAYQHIRTIGFDGRVYKFNPIELSGGIFARYKPFYNFFAHFEYEVANDKVAVSGFSGPPVIETFTENNFYIGAGYTSGGRISSEIYILYNVLEESNTLQPPWTFRAGLSYNF